MSELLNKKFSDVLIRKYFEDRNFLSSDIDSFTRFIEEELQEIIEENKEIEPTIIPHNIDEYKIKFDKIIVTKPEITEADGSTRLLYPNEARLRKLSYSAPVFMEVSAHIDGIQRESHKIQIANIPIMLKSKFNGCFMFLYMRFKFNDEQGEEL